MVRVRTHLDDHELKNYIQKALYNYKTLRPLFKLIAVVLRNSIIANFRMGGRPEKWSPLSLVTIRQRVREKTWPSTKLGQPILIAHGNLLHSIGTVKEFGKDHMEYGTNDKRANTLQYGAPPRSEIVTIPQHLRRMKSGVTMVRSHKRKVHWGAIPSRPFILYQDSDIQTIVGYAEGYLMNPEAFRSPGE